MYCIKSIQINNFKQIKKIELNDLPESKWIFITGENGFGKTVFLQAIATSLNPIDNILNETIAESGNKMTSLILLNSDHSFGIYFDDSGINDYSKMNIERNSYFKFLVCYGSSRLETLAEISQQELNSGNNGFSRLFRERTILRNIEFEMIKWKLKSELRNISDEERMQYESRFDWTKKLLIDLLDIEDIVVNETEEKVLYVEKDQDGKVLIGVKKEYLGSGYKALLGIIGDLIIQLFTTQPENQNPKELVGIVLIDEIELHLHPKWQKHIPKVLSKYFPNVQFVASTHSPIPLLGAPEKSIFLKIERTTEDGITVNRLKKLEKDIKYLLPNAVFTSEIFGLSEIESNYEPDIDAIRTTDDYNEIEELEKAKERLRNIDESIFPKDLFNTKK